MNERKTIELTGDARTIVEYEAMIRRFLQTGMLDREAAIAKCMQFNRTHPEYAAMAEIQNVMGSNQKPWKSLMDEEIVSNMNLQLIYIGGKNMLEGMYGLTRKA